MAIGEVAQRAGMSTSRIRYYEARGLLPEPDRAAGKRRYGDDACVEACPVDACFAEDQLPEKWQRYTQISADFYKRG
jgi:ferredoxin